MELPTRDKLLKVCVRWVLMVVNGRNLSHAEAEIIHENEAY